MPSRSAGNSFVSDQKAFAQGGQQQQVSSGSVVQAQVTAAAEAVKVITVSPPVPSFLAGGCVRGDVFAFERSVVMPDFNPAAPTLREISQRGFIKKLPFQRCRRFGSVSFSSGWSSQGQGVRLLQTVLSRCPRPRPRPRPPSSRGY